MNDVQLMRALQLRKSAFYQHLKLGHLSRFSILNPIGRARWSGKRVTAYLSGGAPIGSRRTSFPAARAAEQALA